MNGKIDRTKTIELAERQVRAGKLAEAIAEYKKLLEGDAQDVTIVNIIGDLYLRLGQNEEAIKVFQLAARYYEAKGLPTQALAIYKKITKLAPDNVGHIIKLADLFGVQGFTTEARKEYLKAEDLLRKEKRFKEIITIYEKIVSLDENDLNSKLVLADLYVNEGQKDDAVARLNEAAEHRIRQGHLKEAKEILSKAKGLKEYDERTLINLVEIFRKESSLKEAVSLINEALERDSASFHLQNLLGSLYFEDKDFKKAEEVFAKIIAERPLDVKARIKLGRVYVLQGDLDKTFELYDPLIGSLVKRGKEEKAIGLLGIILSTGKNHLPSLERLASIYRAKDEKENLDVVYRVIVEECRERNLKDKMFVMLSELVDLNPNDDELAKEYLKIKKELGFLDERRKEGELLAQEEAGETLETILAKADLYIQQGLFRNARRILENLSLKYPEDERINERITFLEQAKTEISEEELLLRVGKISAIESKLEGKAVKVKTLLSLFKEEEGAGEEKVTSADIFSGIDIIPLSSQEQFERKYFDLEDKAHDELEIIKAVHIQQMKGSVASYEKELSEIVSAFRQQTKDRIDGDDYDAHYHLGLAFFEQGLIEEAIEEFMIAAQNEELAFECCTLISSAFRRKQDFKEAVRWTEKCLEIATEDPERTYALEYEMASLYEELKETKKALDLYHKIEEWNAGYRDVVDRVRNLESAS